MMHELAHNKQMNHAKAFWKVKNAFSDEMRVLWDRGYTGEGLWGRGVLLENGAFAREELGEGEVLPEHMCGGTFRSRGGRKRKAKPKITYKERQEWRIKKKFGTNGVTLGADEDTKVKLENGKRPAGKPRVAGSASGRELRAAAALARFETKKEEPQIKDEDLVTDSETESDMEDDIVIKVEADDAVDIDGKRLLDSKGQGMVKVCEDEDKDNEDAKRELQELLGLANEAKRPPQVAASKPEPAAAPAHPQASKPVQKSESPKLSKSITKQFPKQPEAKREEVISTTGGTSIYGSVKKPQASSNAGICPVCSVENEPTALTCIICSNTLKPEFVPNSWRCKSPTCNGSGYINAGDVGLCGVCGTRKYSNDGI
jgi:hypothetical protein